MANRSFQNEIPPARVNIQLSVEKGNAQKKHELPLKLLVLGDFTHRKDSTRVVDREKININKDNFDQVMKSLNLELTFSVPNRLSPDGGELPVALRFDSIKSFSPFEIAKQVPAIGRLIAARNLIKDLGSNLLDNREFRKRMELILKDQKCAQELLLELDRVAPLQD
jgi:type VI secretion system protein ImpB